LSSRKTALTLVAVVVALSACAKDEGDVKRDLTRREKDSILGASQIPGARAVKKTLSAADSAAARQARLDSADREP
jgi:uncharacterized lipoprotein NlpE involved in copper resistance